MAESNDLTQALTEYGSAASPYSALDDYLMQRPVFDRGARQAPASPTLRTLEAITPDTDQLLAEQYDRIMAEQEAADEAATLARQTEIDNLRDLLREELATSEDAALSQRSDITKALESRIADLQSDIDAETLGLRQAGLDERAALARQIEEGDRLVREAQEASVGSLQERIGSLSGDLSDINAAIDANYNLLDQAQQNAADATQAEITGLNNQLESLYADVESGNAAQSETIRNETANLIADLEQQIGGLADNLGALPIETIQSQLASVNDQTAQFQQAVDTATGERAALASRIDALQAAGLTQDDLAAAINPIAQQRQEAISAAVNPIQEQISALRQEIPQQVDTEALRQQIKDEIMASLPQQQTAPVETVTQPIAEPVADASVDVGPSASEASGFNPAASVNVSDGQADAMGLFDDPRPMQQFNRTPGVRDTVAVPVMRGNQMTGRTGPFIPDMRDIMQGVNVRGAGL
jgi:predicted  nucleic acid-binding Zn-ribbon protein